MTDLNENDLDMMRFWMTQGGNISDVAQRFNTTLCRASRNIDIAAATKADILYQQVDKYYNPKVNVLVLLETYK